MNAWLSEFAHIARFAFEAFGIVVVATGAVIAIVIAAMQVVRTGSWSVRDFRSRLGRSILLGLEFLVAGDIIATVAFEPTLESVAILAGIVAIRTFLSFSLEVEIDGKWPWQRRAKDTSKTA